MVRALGRPLPQTRVRRSASWRRQGETGQQRGPWRSTPTTCERGSRGESSGWISRCKRGLVWNKSILAPISCFAPPPAALFSLRLGEVMSQHRMPTGRGLGREHDGAAAEESPDEEQVLIKGWGFFVFLITAFQ
ncbi:hypothetical protein MUK42_08183 [Musa troglodytarum]|uniref:Uncharacterized protein n=1 Tax=Musa troglodytarum TaxID=320322 RepID=A0A9E7IAA3_9LILI|nr:hypothetical protein MUK42_08183 [Musa troglodytarum]